MAESLFSAGDDAQQTADREEARFGNAGKIRLNIPRRKKALFSLIVVLLSMLATEAVLWLVGYESPVADPYESFVLHRPLFLQQGERLATSPARKKFFHVQDFVRSKRSNTRRIFVFGGSTTFGWRLPEPLRDSYVNQLGQLLSKEFPSTRFEMINCGGVSYASYRLVDLVEECLEYAPDLIIVMSGHNEFTEARHYADLKEATSTSNRLWYSLRTVRLVQHLSNKIHSRKPFLGENPWVNERYIVRDKEEYVITLDHYRRNLVRMVNACRSHTTPLILCTCPSNILDNPPYNIIDNPPLVILPPSVQEQEFKRHLLRATELAQNGNFEESLAIAQTRLQDDPTSAIFHYISGKCYYGMKRMREAQKSLMLAKDLDVYPTRARSSFNQYVRDTARQANTYLFDSEALFLASSADGVPGNDLFLDDCHPTVDGHRLFAEGLKEISAKILRQMEN